MMNVMFPLNGQSHICNCIGPRNGEPLCPCSMRGVIVRDGRYILPERDLGPVRPGGDLIPDRNSASGHRLDWLATGFKARFF